MIEKYILYGSDNEIIAIKFNSKSEKIVVGGNSSFNNFMVSVVEDYFKERIIFVKCTFTQVNKVRYNFNIGKRRFDKGMDRLRKHEFVIEQVKSHERIMR